MSYRDIANMATTIYPEDMDRSVRGIHESCLRSYHILAKVKWLLEKKT